MNLSRKQQEVFNDIINAPEYDMGSHQWCDTHIIRENGEVYVNGNWNTNTLKALERKGVITIIRIGDWWNDVVQLNDWVTV